MGHYRAVMLGVGAALLLAGCGGASQASASGERAGTAAIEAAASGIHPAQEMAGRSDRLEPGTATSRRYALVFGNGAYRHGDALGAPPRDAALMARALQARGYHVLVGIDRDLAGMQSDLAAFEAMSHDAELRVLYFAGHGFEIDGTNYLMPVDLPANIAELDRAGVRRAALRLDQAAWRLEQDVPLLVAIIDACRVLPARGRADRFSFAKEQPPQGAILAFATAPGQVAMDSLRAYGVDEDHSPYSYYLANALLSPAVRTWDQAFLSTYAIVDSRTRGTQQPWMNARVDRFPQVGPLQAVPAGGPASVLGIAITPERRAAARYWAGEALAADRLAIDGSVPDAELRRRAHHGDARAGIALAARLRDSTPAGAQTIALLEPLAEAGNAVAQTDLGSMLHAIKGADSQGRSARHWWSLASAQGVGEARAKLALLDGSGDMESLQEFMRGMVEHGAAFAPEPEPVR